MIVEAMYPQVQVYRDLCRSIPEPEAALLADEAMCYEIAKRQLRKRGLRREPTPQEVERLVERL